jgi:hypothetical protein
MPIVKSTPNSAPYFEPRTDYPVVKYMDIVKFLSLLSRSSLFFCRYDKLGDKLEGKTAPTNFEPRVETYKDLLSMVRHKPVSNEEAVDKVKGMYDFENKLRNLNCANCWNKWEQESAALWKIYSDFGKGIMIKSSIYKIYSAFDEAPENIFCSEIHYLDYKKDIMPDFNTMYPLIHKHSGYKYEDEVRLIYSVDMSSIVEWEYDWSKEEVEEGKYIKINLDKLIEEIVVSPYSPNWFYKLIEDLVSKYNLNKPIHKSELSTN